MTNKDVITKQLGANQKIVADIFADGEMVGVPMEDLSDVDVDDTQNITDEEKCVEDIEPADIPYDKYMNVVRENEELKETIVKLVKKLNECKFFD